MTEMVFTPKNAPRFGPLNDHFSPEKLFPLVGKSPAVAVPWLLERFGKQIEKASNDMDEKRVKGRKLTAKPIEPGPSPDRAQIEKAPPFQPATSARPLASRRPY